MFKKNNLLKANGEKIKEFLEGSPDTLLDEKTLKEIKEINKTGIYNVEAFFKKIVSKITQEPMAVDANDIEKEINAILQTQEGKDLDAVLGVYKKQIAALRLKNVAQYEALVDKDVASAIYNGFTKIFKTAHEVLSIPGKIIDWSIKRCFKNSNKIFDDVAAKLAKQNPEVPVEDYQKELAKFAKILKRNAHNEYDYEKTIEHIKRHIENFEETPETGDLAHLSRTLVTLISSWFYINDFRNTVLIESAGENTQRAREVMNDSIGYKTSNFFFNGTLMNLANSLFKDTLNKSLFAAAVIPAGTEFLNEFLIRKTIARPMHKMKSRDEVIEYERSRMNKDGLSGAWTRLYKKITGQKSLSEKYEAQKAKKN